MKDVDNTQQHSPLRCISLCTGYGGIEQGLALAGVAHQTVAYVEIEAFAISNLVAAMEQGAIPPAPIWSDLKTFDAQPFCDNMDIITGGYPCQPFSAAGKRDGAKDPRHLWPHIRGIVETARPVFCFFENVEGHLTLGYDQVYRDLRELGYTVEAGLFSSRESGGQHQRKRLFIMAVHVEYAKGRRARIRTHQTSTRQGSRTDRSSRGMELSESITSNMGDAERRKSPTYSPERSKSMADTRLQRSAECKEQTTGTKQLCKSMADTSDKRLQRNKRSQQDRERSEHAGSVTQRCPIAGPNAEQYTWEEPRQNTNDALKSRLGLPVNGYNYRTDQLRMLGNGVDPWTAAIAWNTLYHRMVY